MPPKSSSVPPSPTSASRPGQHAPLYPSSLREAHTPVHDGSDDHRDSSEETAADEGQSKTSINEGYSTSERHASRQQSGQSSSEQSGTILGSLESRLHEAANETTALLRKPVEFVSEHVHPGPCNHGTFSPRAISRAGSFRSSGSTKNDFGGPYPGRGEGSESPSNGSRGITDSITEPLLGSNPKRSTTQWLAETHGVKNTKTMYLAYYVPFFAWVPQYRLHHLKGDLVAALTVASMYIPMALSLAANLGHIPPINGLYSFVFNPLIYALLGSCPQMIVGPEAAGSLLVGSVVKNSVDSGHAGDDDDEAQARVAGVVTAMAGAAIFVAGLTRLGFLDNVLSRPFLRGFISAIGFVIFVDQLIPEMGLYELASGVGGINHGSSIDKLGFLFKNIGSAHGLTCAVSGISFLVTMVLRELKRRLQPRYPSVAYVPDRFFIVVMSAVLCWALDWEGKGVEILGNIKAGSGTPFPFHWPFQLPNMKHVRSAMGTSFLIALLGFFESSVAAKSLGGETKDGIQGIQLSPNRELVALGAANLVGGCFMALPAFGGYGRSKVNASTGGKTPMSSIFLSTLTIICILFLLPYFYYLPKAVLSTMISVVAWSLIEEAPHDVEFFIRVRGYTELGLMFVICAATIFYSLELGMAIGIFLSLLSVIRHSTRPRIQILGRLPGTNKFENAEENPQKLEFVEGCLIVKIPEPLTFANTGDMKNRLRRLELYGTNEAHPALPRVRSEEHNRNIIFDIHGVTSLDASGAQVLAEIVSNYRERGVRVFFSRGPSENSPIWTLFQRSGIVDTVGGRSRFVNDIQEALVLSEVEDLGEIGASISS